MFAWNVGKVYLNHYNFNCSVTAYHQGIYSASTVRTWSNGVSLTHKNQTKCSIYRCVWIGTASVEILNAFTSFIIFAWNVGKVYLNHYNFNCNGTGYHQGIYCAKHGVLLTHKIQTKFSIYRCMWICTARVENINVFTSFSMIAWNFGKVYLNHYNFNCNVTAYIRVYTVNLLSEHQGIYSASTVGTWSIADTQKSN